MNYFFAFAIGFPLAVASLDWFLKGMWKWEDLDELRKGWSWHFIIAGVFTFLIALVAIGDKNPWLMFGLLGIVNEDLIFYLFKSGELNRLWPPSSWCFNDWLFNSKQQYYWTIFVANLMMFIVIMWKG